MPNNNLRKLILCVDNHPDTIGFMSIWLSQEGYDVKTVGSYKEALKVVQRDHVALSILDVHLTDVDGFDLCRKILACSPGTMVIFNSGDTRQETKNQAKDAGAKAFFGKPIDFDEMDAVIHQLIGMQKICRRAE